MNTLRLSLTALVGLVALQAQFAAATTLPIDFEAPTYSTTFTHSGLPAGTINLQDGWDTFAGIGVGGIAVADDAPISGDQSLKVPGDTKTRAQGTAPLGAINRLSWLLRVDASGGGSFESGLGDPAISGSPAVIQFESDGSINYFDGSSWASLDSGVWSAGTVYRVDLTNIDYGADTYDVAIVDVDAASTVASLTGVDSASNLDSTLIFYVLTRGNTSALAYVDNVTIPEPASLVLLGLSGLGVLCVRRRRFS